MKPDIFSVRACSLDPNCLLNLENVDLLNQVIVYGLAGIAGVMATIVLVIYTILAVRKAAAMCQRLLGMT